MEFVAWPKIARWDGEEMTITEKLDGTNACIVIDAAHDITYAQSRTRVITPESDNFGFARWVQENEDTLAADLGPGRHFGEWWGSGIQRNYGLDHKRFSLFNAHKYPLLDLEPFKTPNLHVVPVLYEGPFEAATIQLTHTRLRFGGSVAVPGWDKPEGVVVYLHRGKTSYKITDAVQGKKHREDGI